MWGALPQGSACRATLGFGTESRWDWNPLAPLPRRQPQQQQPGQHEQQHRLPARPQLGGLPAAGAGLRPGRHPVRAVRSGVAKRECPPGAGRRGGGRAESSVAGPFRCWTSGMVQSVSQTRSRPQPDRSESGPCHRSPVAPCRQRAARSGTPERQPGCHSRQFQSPSGIPSQEASQTRKMNKTFDCVAMKNRIQAKPGSSPKPEP